MLEDSDQRIAITPDLSARMVVDDEPLDPPPGLSLMLHGLRLKWTCSVLSKQERSGTSCHAVLAASAIPPFRPSGGSTRTPRVCCC